MAPILLIIDNECIEFTKIKKPTIYSEYRCFFCYRNKHVNYRSENYLICSKCVLKKLMHDKAYSRSMDDN